MCHVLSLTKQTLVLPGLLVYILKTSPFRDKNLTQMELGWDFPGWDLSHFAKFGIFMGIL